MKAKLSAFLLLLALVAGCAKDPDFPPPTFDNTYLHIIGGANSVDSFAVVFDYWNADDVVIGKFWHNKNWPSMGYADLTAGGTPDEYGNGKLYLHTIKYNSPSVGMNDTLVNHHEVVMGAEEKSTLCFVDSGAGMVVVKFLDQITDPAAGMVNVRFINLLQTVDNASLSDGGSFNVNGIAFRNASGFVQVPAGTYTLNAVNDASGMTLSTVNNLLLYERGTYTFYLTGNAVLSYFTH